MSVQIDVLLATFNGQKYIADQLDSLLNQSMDSWRLLVRDDGSSDSTMAIVQEYAERHPEKIEIISDGKGNLGPCGSYAVLLEKSRSPYVAFCDQDDVWLPDKLDVQMKAMLGAECRLPANSPILVHTDMLVVDEDMSVISESFWDYQKLNPDKMATLQRLLIQNHVTACATLINRSLAEMSVPVPAAARMHDWWIALVAIISGEILSVQRPTLKYRQHEANDTGAKKWGWHYFLGVLMGDADVLRKDLLKTRDQAGALLLHPSLAQENKSVVQRYIDLYEKDWLGKRYYMMKYGYLKFSLIRNIGLFLFA